jgi:dihydroorotate dehydrogenase
MAFRGATSVLGSFTFLPRPGRFFRILTTVRRIPGGWVNSIGLRNPGIQSLSLFHWDTVYSLAAIGPSDWYCIAEYLRSRSELCRRGIAVELNLSCPNVAERGITPREIETFTSRPHQFQTVIAKISPESDRALWQAEAAVRAGVDHLHIGNAYPSPAGGISGRPLLSITPATVEAVAERFPTVSIIAGGGISRPEHVKTYADAGATRFSISTGCLHPMRIRRLIRSSAAGVEHQESPIPATRVAE